MKKVSAVDWLAEQLLTKYRLKIDNYQEFEQAKEMLETLGLKMSENNTMKCMESKNLNTEENANGTKPVLGEVCPNCKTELYTAYLSNARSGGHLFDVTIDFCEECLYIGDADCTNVSR